LLRQAIVLLKSSERRQGKMAEYELSQTD
jgi:hypothetical protein